MKDGKGGKDSSQIRERKRYTKLQGTPSEAIGGESDVASSDKVRYSDDPRPTLATGFFSFLLWLVPYYLTDRDWKSSEDRPSFARAFLYFLLVIFVLYLTHERTIIISWLAMIISFSLSLCIAFLSESINLLEFSLVRLVFALIAFCLGSFMGMLLMYLSTVYTAWVCGREVAKICQSSGTENSAEIAFRCSKLQMKTYDPIVPFIMLCLLCLTCAARVLLICRMPPEDPTSAVMDISFMVTICMFAWTCYINCVLLNSSLFKEQDIGIGFLSGFILMFMLMFVVALWFGEAVSVIVPWISAMATAGLYGYTYDVFCKYRILMEGKLEA